VRYKGRFYIGKAHGWREKAALEEVHDSALGGHSERDKRVKSMCYWPKLKQEVHSYVKTCDVCQMNKGEHIHTPGLLQPVPVPIEAWQGA
jgi:hypothetical protein